jgi:hypothetical protein
VTPIQWNDSKDNVDFFDVKGVFEGLMDLVSAKDYQLVPGTEPFLHPGKSCDIIYSRQEDWLLSGKCIRKCRIQLCYFRGNLSCGNRSGAFD